MPTGQGDIRSDSPQLSLFSGGARELTKGGSAETKSAPEVSLGSELSSLAKPWTNTPPETSETSQVSWEMMHLVTSTSHCSPFPYSKNSLHATLTRPSLFLGPVQVSSTLPPWPPLPPLPPCPCPCHTCVHHMLNTAHGHNLQALGPEPHTVEFGMRHLEFINQLVHGGQIDWGIGSQSPSFFRQESQHT